MPNSTAGPRCESSLRAPRTTSRLEDERLYPELRVEQHLRREVHDPAAEDPLDGVSKLAPDGIVDGVASRSDQLSFSRREQGPLDKCEQIAQDGDHGVAGEIGLRARRPFAVMPSVKAHYGVGHLGE